jgi:hypothetical protein
VLDIIPGIGLAGIGKVDASIKVALGVGKLENEIQPVTLLLSPLQGPIQQDCKLPQPSGDGGESPAQYCHPSQLVSAQQAAAHASGDDAPVEEFVNPQTSIPE